MSAHEEFRGLHRTGAPLVLPNAWDHASAAALVGAGFRAVGTTSLGVASAAGKSDAAGAARAETVALARGLARLDALVSVDVEGGFSDDPHEVAELARTLTRAGVVGLNIEDGLADGTLTDPEHQSAVIRAVKRAAPELFVNARTDTHWLSGPVEETGDRVTAYQEAGADGVFVPGLRDRERIRALVDTLEVPLNILHSPDGPSLAELTALGVRRVSCGSLLFRAALQATVAAATAVREDLPVPDGLPTYAEAQALADAYR